ncbi:hypothetical protein [Denitromonas sp.]|uniref:DUF7483 domain-containing protein n=1 Tax=Denitromonas sp. TaxID=2734609 RepID=UPI003A8B80C8
MIVPGSPNALLMAQAGDPLDEFGKIERSVRIRRTASAGMSRTQVLNAAGTTGTFLFRLKRGQLGVLQSIFSWSNGATAYNILFNADDTLDCGSVSASAYVSRKNTARVFRDPGAWLDVMVVQDTTNATAADRLRVYVNGVRETSFLNSVDCAKNTVTNLAQNWAWGIGHQAGTNTYYSDVVLAHAIFVDGQALSPASFGQLNPRTAQWRTKTKAAIKAVVESGGAGSFFLDFSDPTSLATLSSDQSSKGNNWTATNISLTAGVTYDSMLDTPTNNFPTLNPLWKDAGVTLGDGNLTVVSGGNRGGVSTFPAPTGGRYQFEATVTSTVITRYVSIFKATAMSGSLADIDGGSSVHAYSYYPNGSKFVKNVNSAYGSAWGTVGDVIGAEVDLVANTLTFYKNGVSQGAIPIDAGVDYFFGGSNATSDSGSLAFNFGQRPFAYPIAGAKPLCTKNLPLKPPVMKSADAFVAKTNSGANIVADLSAASPWSDWIRIYKRRDGAEGWRWQFSDDAGFYLDCYSTAAKAAFPALAGTSYMGYALRVGAQFGVATGRLAHVNGVADVVADGLGKSRKMIILKGEGAGDNWAVHHPELTAGKLVYLNGTAAETTDATISAVTTAGFTVAAALPSGTYRWIAVAETEGFISLRGYTGNASTDGPFYMASQQAGLVIEKGVTASANWNVHDALRNPGNVAAAALYTNLSNAEDASNPNVQIDINANGVKVRHYASPYNLSGYKYISLLIGGTPFRYANAR